eukprot:8125410-Pyramimonas_sp.AAC.1
MGGGLGERLNNSWRRQKQGWTRAESDRERERDRDRERERKNERDREIKRYRDDLFEWSAQL